MLKREAQVAEMQRRRRVRFIHDLLKVMPSEVASKIHTLKANDKHHNLRTLPLAESQCEPLRERLDSFSSRSSMGLLCKSLWAPNNHMAHYLITHKDVIAATTKRKRWKLCCLLN
ncbi:hypothetical protein JHK86_007998 [Glycine max]|nr:hypothetical protein JHK86_007998 [Glycine max]